MNAEASFDELALCHYAPSEVCLRLYDSGWEHPPGKKLYKLQFLGFVLSACPLCGPYSWLLENWQLCTNPGSLELRPRCSHLATLNNLENTESNEQDAKDLLRCF